MVSFVGFSQESTIRTKTIKVSKDTLTLDSLTIYPNSFQVFCGGVQLSRNEYELNYAQSKFSFTGSCGDSLKIVYRVLPMNLSRVYGARDTSLIYNENKGNKDLFLITEREKDVDFFGGSSLSKSGSISRGITFGNSQNLGVNSSLNLELEGDIAPNLKMLASISDNNIPIQADGNTNKLQEFDQIYIKIYNDRLQLTAGDFWLYKPKGYFMTYKKRAQGLTVSYIHKQDSIGVWKSQTSGALSKGKFARQIVQGVEGNQGPYRLKGNENEPFIIILAGTERVYIDGRLLDRGQEYDYTIDYNSSEVTFTSRNLITKDSRIVIEFQYSDQNYARSLLQNSITYESEKLNFWLNSYTEQDAKNQTIQQSLSNNQKLLLSEIGDSLSLARTSSIDSIGFVDNQVLYKVVDSLGYDSVLVFTVNQDSAFYRAVFEYVGAGKGNYVFQGFNALGKVYRWVVPLGNVPQGDYEPSRLIVTPKQKQLVSAGIDYKINKRLSLFSEVAYSKNDINTFSTLDSKDDPGVAIRSKLISVLPLSKDSIPKWNLETKLEIETLEKHFSPIEQYRAVEFDRDWNTRNKGFQGNQLSTNGGLNFQNAKVGNINIEGQRFTIGSDYKGTRTVLNGKLKHNGYFSTWDASYLQSEALTKNQFLRHNIEVNKQVKFLKVGFKDIHEYNTFDANSYTLDLSSYQFYEYEFYLSSGDSSSNKYKLFYKERFDKHSDSLRLVNVAKARTAGGEISLLNLKNQRLNIITSYRELEILNEELIQQKPENSLLGRIDYELKAFKNAITWNNFYEIGSGLELKREFLYVQVTNGQGIYTWIDYNGDGVKDLNEFEIAQYKDQAAYVRVFTPSNSYVKTYSNELNQGLFIKPERIWSQAKGIRKVLSYFSDQARIRMLRKTNYFNGVGAFNPFASSISDTNLISTSSNIKNTLFFNRTSSIFGADYTYQDVKSKVLLSNGFDLRQNTFNEISMRWNIKRKFTIEIAGQQGFKKSQADYTSGRDYFINYGFIKPSLIFQPNTSFRVTLDGRYSDKKNDEALGGEKALTKELGGTFKYNRAQKGSLNGAFNMIQINYSGVQSSAVGFEMLEALKPGLNFTWNIGYQHSISKTLQLSFQYNGRKSESNKVIHSGGMEVRAFF